MERNKKHVSAENTHIKAHSLLLYFYRNVFFRFSSLTSLKLRKCLWPWSAHNTDTTFQIIAHLTRPILLFWSFSLIGTATVGHSPHNLNLCFQKQAAWCILDEKNGSVWKYFQLIYCLANRYYLFAATWIHSSMYVDKRLHKVLGVKSNYCVLSITTNILESPKILKVNIK